jgi:hypothetical protein
MSACPIPNCGTAVHAGKLMRLQHWTKVPHKLQLQVLKSWNAVGRSKTVAGRRIKRTSYRAAADAAITAVTPKEPA